MSKQEMARKLIALGCTKSFNTLRKYSVETLEGMLSQAMPTTMPEIELPEPTVTNINEQQPALTDIPPTSPLVVPGVPTDRGLYVAALNAREPAPVPVAQPVGLAAWLALALTPLGMLGRIVGV